MSYFKLRNLLLVLALVLALILLAVMACVIDRQANWQTVVKALPKGVDVSCRRLTIPTLEEGQARWRLVASQAEHQADTKRLAGQQAAD